MIATALFFLAAIIAISASDIADAIRESNSVEDKEGKDEND